MTWFLVLLAGLLEVGWAVGLKYSDGFSRLWPSLATLMAMLASIVLLGIAMRHLPVATAYAIWMGIGLVGTMIAGVLLFGETLSAPRLISVTAILLGVVGLKLSA